MWRYAEMGAKPSRFSLRVKLAVALSLFLTVLGIYFFFFVYTSKAFDGGSGTPDDPYIIGDCAQLQEMDDQPEYMMASFELSGDIDCSAFVPFETIGDYNVYDGNWLPFMGRFDGQGYTISNVTVGSTTSAYNGLFSTMEGAAVRNLTLDNFSVDGTTYLGALVGSARDSAIIGVSVINSTITSHSNTGGAVGGLAGNAGSATSLYGIFVASTTITSTGVDGDASLDMFGGIVGSLAGFSRLDRSTASTTITATMSGVGGLAGEISYGAVITNSYSEGSVTGVDSVGGIVGGYYTFGTNTYIDSVYSRASAVATSPTGGVGGIHGRSNGGGSALLYIANSFAVGYVSSTTASGGITGQSVSAARMTNNVWYPTGTGQTRCASTGGPFGAGQCTSNNTDSYYNSSLNAPLSSWDFTNIWVEVPSDRPELLLFPYTEPASATSIGSCAALASAVRANPVGWFELSGNIDCLNDTSLVPLTGNMATSSNFFGVFDGQGFTVNGVGTSKTATAQYQYGLGLFNKVSGATIRNVTLAGTGPQALYDGVDRVGALAGSGTGVWVENLTSTVPVTTGEQFGGGLLGYGSGFFENIIINADVDNFSTDSYGYWTGGLIGNAFAVQMNNIEYNGNITTYWYSGALVGVAEVARITNATTTGNFVGNVIGGGILGAVSYTNSVMSIKSSIDNAHSSMNFTTNAPIDNYMERIGGIVGYSQAGVDISNSSYTGTISLTDPTWGQTYNVGGLAGELSSDSNSATSTIINSFTDAYITAVGDNGNAPYIENVGGFIGEAGYVAVTDSVSSTTMLFGGSNPSEYTGGTDYVGGFVGYNWSGLLDVSNVQVNGSMTIYDDATGNNGGWGWGLGGFAGYLGSAIVQNSTSSVDIFYQAYEPGAISNFAGEMGYSTLRNVVVDGDLVIDAYENPYYIGGLGGYVDTVTIATTTVTGNITLTNTLWPYDIGGLIGYLDSSSIIQETYTDNTITIESGTDGSSAGPFAVGGFIGEMNWNNTLRNTYASTTINITSSAVGTSPAGGNIGGYVGYVGWTDNSITNSYSTGAINITTDVTSPFVRVGGFIGWSDNSTNTYTDNFTVTSIAPIASSTDVGGFIARYTGGETFADNAFDATVTQQSVCTGIDPIDPAWCTVHNIANAEPTYFYNATNPPQSSWDFTTLWLEHPDTYPTFGVGGGGGGSTPPAVTTDAVVTSITQSGGTVEGNITSLGSGIITARGFVYGLTPLFGATTTENSAGFSTGTYTDDLTGLVCNTTYYFQAYASGTDGSDYGATESFTTSACGGGATPPTISTTAGATSITTTSATLSGNITALGSATITTRGFAYGTTPALGATTTENSAGFATGVYAGNVTSLACGTTYYFTAYATGADGTGYGTQQSFSTAACAPAPTGGGSSGTKVKDTKKDDTRNTLGKTDNITICHSADGSKYVTLTNVQVFITLADNGAVAELRGHDGHDEDIVPSFQYDFGDGIKSYPGNNWSSANQKLHANNCELFLVVPPVPPPTPVPTPTPTPVPPPPTPTPEPEPTPAPVCGLTSVYTKTATKVGTNTTLTTTVPQGAVRSEKTEQKSTEAYTLTIAVKPVENKRADELKVKFTDILERFQDKKGSDEAPYGILKKLDDTSVTTKKTYTSTITTSDTSTVTTNPIPVVTGADCPEATPETPLPPAEETPETPPPSVVEPPVVSPDVPAVIVGDTITEADLADLLPEDLELLMPPVQVVVETPEGEYLEEFESPVTIEITNPDVDGLTKDDLIILQPSEDGTEWYEVPYEVNGDSLTLTISRPGEIFVWFVPKALAAEDAAIQAPRLPLFELTIPLIVAKAISYLGLVTGLSYLLLQLSRFPVTATNLRRVLLEGWHNLIGLLTAKKRRRPWGTVYDSVTKAPVDPAYVELFDAQGAKAAEAITDLDGRYGFLVPEGQYTMQVRKTNYTFPSTRTSLGTQDVIYSQLYFGGPFTVSATVTHDVPMDPQNFDWNQYEKLRTKQTRYFHLLDPLIVRFLDLMFFLGAALMAWQFFTTINLMTSFLLSCYLVLLIARFMGKRPVLFGAITEHNLPLQFALVRIMQGDTTILTKVTDAEGRYVAIVPPDTYTVRIEKRVTDEQYVPVFERKVRAKRGVINMRLRV